MAAVERPNVDVVVPFAGSGDQLRQLLAHMATIALAPGDTLTLVDDRRTRPPLPAVTAASGTRPTVIATGERRGSYHARNQGAGRGTAPWLLFLDADVRAPADLIERYFADPPAADVAVLAGAVLDEPPGSSARPATRYAWLRSSMSAEPLLARGRWAYAQTSNCVVRRAAFEAVGGFREVHSGGDADLCYRLRGAGWSMAGRPEAAVTHRNRDRVRAMLSQRARHGAGAAWLEREHPGAVPRRSRLGLMAWSTRRALSGVVALARHDRDQALLGLLDGPAVWAFELGRLLPNRAPGSRQHRRAQRR